MRIAAECTKKQISTEAIKIQGRHPTDIVALGPIMKKGSIQANPVTIYAAIKPAKAARVFISLSRSSQVTLPGSFLNINGPKPPNPAIPKNPRPPCARDQGIPTIKNKTAVAIAAKLPPIDIQITIHHEIFCILFISDSPYLCMLYRT
jgi:hypothetical protein